MSDFDPFDEGPASTEPSEEPEEAPEPDPAPIDDVGPLGAPFDPVPEEEACARPGCTMSGIDVRNDELVCRVHAIDYDRALRQAQKTTADPEARQVAGAEDEKAATDRSYQLMVQRWTTFTDTFGDDDPRLDHLRAQVDEFMGLGTPLGAASAAAYMHWACCFPDEVGREVTYPCSCGAGMGWVEVDAKGEREVFSRGRVRPCSRCNAEAYKWWFDAETKASKASERGQGVYASEDF